MKKAVFIALLFTLLIQIPSFCQENIGTLHVFSRIAGAQIYIDDELKGMDRVKVFRIQAGAHQVRAVKDGQTVFEEIVNISPGELTTVFIIVPPAKNDKKPAEYRDLMRTGWFLRTGYMTDLFYSRTSSSLNRYASSLNFGLGFQVPVSPRIDFILTLDKGNYASSAAHWFYMPLTANIQFSVFKTPSFGGKHYIGLGIGYFMTDLKSALMQDLSTFGYQFYYGIERPNEDGSSLCFEIGLQNADIGRSGYLLNTQYISIGYRLYLEE